MKAVVYDEYGPPAVLRVEEVPVPVPGPGQLRIKVAATSLNLSDWECLVGSPAYARLGGLRTPATRILGSDIAGTRSPLRGGSADNRLGDRNRRGLRRTIHHRRGALGRTSRRQRHRSVNERDFQERGPEHSGFGPVQASQPEH